MESKSFMAEMFTRDGGVSFREPLYTLHHKTEAAAGCHDNTPCHCAPLCIQHYHIITIVHKPHLS